jgi:multidrug resistance efflux pump
MKLILYGCLLICLVAACRDKTQISPEKRNIVDAVFANGNIDTKQGYKVIANTDGYLSMAYVTEGDSIRSGQTLFRIAGEIQQTQVLNAKDNYVYALTNKALNSPQLEQLELQIRQAQEKYKVDSINFQRYERLLPTKAVARIDYDNAKLTMQASETNLNVLEKNKADLQKTLALNTDNAQAQLRIQKENDKYYLLTAQTNGIVLSVSKRAGELVRKGDVLAGVSAGHMYIKLFIAEDDIDRVSVGQSVLVSLNTEKTKVYSAILTKVYPSFDSSDQSFIAEADFSGQQQPGAGGLKDGTQLQANIIINQRDSVLVIPTLYLEPGDKVILAEGLKEVPVKTGIRNLDYTEILEGLTTADHIVLPKGK